MKELKLNDKVEVIDENISGVVIKLDAKSVTIETDDGFEMAFLKNEVVKSNNFSKISADMFANMSVDEAISHKSSTKRKPTEIKKKKERFEATMEIDLHIHQLTKSYKGMSKHDMLNLQLDTARRQLAFAMQKRIPKVVFIHGVGEGVLKLELEYLFSRYTNIKFYDANYQKYGLGATEVYIFQSKSPND